MESNYKFSDIDEEAKLSLIITYYTLLKNKPRERLNIKELVSDVETLFRRLCIVPYHKTDLSTYSTGIYLDFLQDLKIGLMKYDDTNDFIDYVYNAIALLKSGSVVISQPYENKESQQSNWSESDSNTELESGFILTREIIESARTPNGGFTKSQLAAIGVPWPRPTDWIEQVIGKEITQKRLEDFRRVEYCISKHEKKKKGKEKNIRKGF